MWWPDHHHQPYAETELIQVSYELAKATKAVSYIFVSVIQLYSAEHEIAAYKLFE